MNLPDLLAEAAHIDDPLELLRFLDAKCAEEPGLRQEIERRLAAVGGAALATEAGATPGRPGKCTAEAAPSDIRFIVDMDTRGGAAAADGVDELPDLGDKFRIRERLGEGGMGSVYLADQLAPVQRRVAVKVIKAGMDSAQVLARFAQERQALALMDHPHIARIYDGGMTRAGRPFFVMELVRGLPLTAFCDQAKLSVRERLKLFVPICLAVQHAHQKGVIHRDLKPSNILVGLQDGKPVPKIIDFGVAKAVNQGLAGQTVFTAHDMMVGTLEYMAPEQAALDSLDIDTRADVYSLGVVLYELLCGCLPFSRKEELRGGLDQAIRVLRETDPKAPSTRLRRAQAEAAALAARRNVEPARLVKEIAGDLDWVTMKCLEKSRDRRYATAQGLAADLERHLRDEPVLAAPPAASYRLRKFIRRNRGKVLAAGLALFLLTAAAAVAFVGWGRALRAEKLAKEEAAIHRTLLGFIQHDLFDAVDPAERSKLGLPPDADVRLRTLVDCAAARLGPEGMPEQPLVEAALRLTLAKAYTALGDDKLAESHAAKAEAIRLARLGPRNADRLEALEQLGKALSNQGKLEEAAARYETAAAERAAEQGPDSADVLRLRRVLATLAFRGGRRAEAESSLRETLTRQRQSLGPAADETLRTQTLLGDLLSALGRNAEAEPLLADALRQRRTAFGSSHPHTLGTMNSLAAVLRDKGDLAAANRLYSELLPEAARVFPDDHPIAAVYRNNLASCLIDQGKHAEALAILRQVEPIFLRLGPTHRLTLVMGSNLAAVLAEVGQCEESARRYETLLPRFVERFGDVGDATLHLLDSMSDACRRANQIRRAAELKQRLLAALRKEQAGELQWIARVAQELADVWVQANERAKAAAALKGVLPALPPGSPERRSLEAALAKLQQEDR